jgi:hypothetical protein
MFKVLILLVCLFMSGCANILCLDGCNTILNRCSGGKSCSEEYAKCVATCRGTYIPCKESDEELE